MQTVFYVAYCRIHGRFDISSYSAASTKRFLHGRTEAIRATSRDSMRLAAAMADQPQRAGHSGDQQKQRLRGLLRAATKTTMERSRLAAQGLAIDRHLLALRSRAARFLHHDSP